MTLDERLWLFPMDFALKTIGKTQAPISQIVTNIVTKYIPDFDARSITLRPSGRGKYIAVTAHLYLTHKEQIEGIYADLNAHREILWAL